MEQDSASVATGKQSFISLDELGDALGDAISDLFSSVVDGLDQIVEALTFDSSDDSPAFASLKARFLQEGSLDARELKALESLGKGRKASALIWQLHDLAGIKDDFQLYGTVPANYRGRVEKIAQSQDPELRDAAMELLSRMDAEAASPSIQPSYDKFMARFLRDGKLRERDLETLPAMAKACGEGEKNRIYDLLDMAILIDTYGTYEDLSPKGKLLLAELMQSGSPELSEAARNLTSKMATDAARTPIDFTAPLPPRAELKYQTFSQQDDYQKDLLVRSLTSDPQVMEALKNFDSLSLRDKTNLAQAIADKQAAIYGFEPTEIYLDPGSPHNEGGGYSFATKRVRLGALALNDPTEFVNTIAHEHAHAYQHQVEERLSSGTLSKDDPLYRTAEKWLDNQKAYIPAPNDSLAEAKAHWSEYQAKQKKYQSQPVEKHAWETGDYVSAEVMKQVKE